jgi:site-specific DNA recombinase
MRDWCKKQGYTVAVEYIEPGASATDDRRLVFQQMIVEACMQPAPFEAVVVHSLSRFFRDALEFGLYERQLNKHGVKLISITQQTSEDPAGEMARKIFSLFDEYQSKENAKHTLRAMKENAQRGFFNGSRPPYGFKVIEAEEKGRNGRKKRLEMEPDESRIVKMIFSLYLGEARKAFGMKTLSAHLNGLGLTARGRNWTKGHVNEILANTAYIGELYFNKVSAKSRQAKPESEWILVKVPAMVDKETFRAAKERREERQPEKKNPYPANSPTLLTGLLKCGACGAGMTLATGSGGRYRYYKCTNRINKGNEVCTSGNIPMEKLDELILKAISEKVFTPERVAAMLKELQERLNKSRSHHDEHLQTLKKELDELKNRMDRLCDAIENGILPNDVAQERSRKIQTRRQDVLVEMSGLKRQQEFSLKDFGPKRINAFCSVLRTKLSDKESNFGKEYLKLLVEEIRIEGKEVRMRGKSADVVNAMQKTALGFPVGLPRTGSVWLRSADKTGHWQELFLYNGPAIEPQVSWAGPMV